MEIKTIRISKRPNFIVLSNFGERINYHYLTDNSSLINRWCDKGIWHIKYKTKLDN